MSLTREWTLVYNVVALHDVKDFSARSFSLERKKVRIEKRDDGYGTPQDIRDDFDLFARALDQGWGCTLFVHRAAASARDGHAHAV